MNSDSERGAVVSLVLMIMFGLFLLAAAVMALKAADYKAAYVERDLKRAMYAAEAGVERAIYVLNLDSDWSDSTPASALYTNEPLNYSAGGDVPYTGRYTVTLTSRGMNDVKITSVGTVNSSVRKVIVRITR